MKSIAKNSPNKKIKMSRQYLNLVVIREELCYLEDLIVSPSCWIWTILKIMTFNTGQGAESLTTDGPMGIEYSYPRPIRWAPHRGGCIIPLWLCPLRWAYLGDAERRRVEDQNIVEDESQDLLSGATGRRILINRTVFTTVWITSVSEDPVFTFCWHWGWLRYHFPGRQVSGDLVWAEKIKTSRLYWSLITHKALRIGIHFGALIML